MYRQICDILYVLLTDSRGKQLCIDVGISADIKEFLTALLPLIKKNDHADWVSQSTEWKKKIGDVKSQDAELHPSEIIQSICDKTDNSLVIPSCKTDYL